MKRFTATKGWPNIAVIVAILCSLIAVLAPATPAAAATTSITVNKYDPYGNLIDTQTITWEEMMTTLPVQGDGITHYYMHGPTFDDSSFDLLWDTVEMVNIDTRDYGAAMGTDLKDLCELVGGAAAGDTIQIKAADNFNKWVDFEDVYNPEPEQGKMVVTWYTTDTYDGSDDGYVDSGYGNGMRLIFFPETVNPEGKHVFGNWDMHETLPASRWHYYHDGSFWPSSSGLSVKIVSSINIYEPNLVSCDASGNSVDTFAAGETVYVKGLGLDASTSYNLWIQEEPVKSLDILDRPSGSYILNTGNDPSGTQEIITTDSNGDFGPVAIWNAADVVSKYDIVADCQSSGTVGAYDSSDYIDNPGWQGFEISGLPVADFSADATLGAAPFTVNFTDTSSGTPTSWEWDFDNDGTVDSYDQNPSYTYTTAGSYTVKLTVTNSYGSDDEIKTDYITAATQIWYVDDSGGADFTTIQDAIDTAAEGDTIIVRDGTYVENVVVDKTLYIESQDRESMTAIVTAAVSSAPVFDVNADEVEISWFVVQGPTDSHVAGIELVDANDCMIEGNDCSGCYNGIHLGGAANGNLIIRNYCHDNTQRGISVRDTAHDNYIGENTVENNLDEGFCIKDTSSNNIIWCNNVIGNGVEMLTSNTYNSEDPINYSYNGNSYAGYLGNYYEDYTGSDADGNGIGDTPYSFGTYSDDYPLMGEWHNGEIITAVIAPVAEFTADVTSGDAPLSVNFTDLSANSPTSWEWDFDNDGTVDSYDQNPSYTYTTAGSYTVKLTVTNSAGSDEEVKTDYITVNSSQPDWDLNGDHICNIGDVVVLGLHWEETGTPGWIPEDLNSDGIINIGDIVVLGLHWEETW